MKMLELLLKENDLKCINCGSLNIEPVSQEKHYIPSLIKRVGRAYAGVSLKYSCLSCKQEFYK